MADFVLAILDPNAALNPNFLAYNIETKDGRTLTGLVRGETASGLTLVQGGGVEEKILRGDLAEIPASTLSLMPEGMEQALSPQDMAGIDLAKFRGHCHVRHARKRRFTCAHCFFSSFSPSLRPLPSGPHPAPTRTR